MYNIDPRTKEIFTIAQEEAAEVIVEMSKCMRFGIDTVKWKTQRTHQVELEQEIGDFLCMVDLLKEQGLVSDLGLKEAKERKLAKLHEHSSIFK
jgi:hypothetical protein